MATHQLKSKILFPAAVLCLLALSVTLLAGSTPKQQLALGPITVFGYNDLGMHCMNEDFSEIAILPPYNNLRAQVIRRGVEPQIITSGATVRYSIPTNTRSADKTNFWRYSQPLFGVALQPDVGLAGKGLSGTMQPVTGGHWQATGIPVTPILDTGVPDPYPVAVITATVNGQTGTTNAIVPVSTEISCNLCHGGPGISVATDILRDHDKLHNTNLEASKPVLCASCHADNALGTPGTPGVPNLSSAMHAAHAPRMDLITLENKCYACHPGIRTQCQRDVHFANNIHCTNCHGDMVAVGNPARNPWVDEPRCTDCHSHAGYQFEQPNTLFKDSVGHGGMHCTACHGSPHAITPTVTAIDNEQAIAYQGHAGVIDTCIVCHTTQPSESFFHSVND